MMTTVKFNISVHDKKLLKKYSQKYGGMTAVILAKIQEFLRNEQKNDAHIFNAQEFLRSDEYELQ